MLKEMSIADDLGYAQNLYFLAIRIFFLLNNNIKREYTK